MPKADFIHLPGFLRGFGLKDHTTAFTPVLESQVGKETAKDTTSQQEMISKRESDEKKRKEVRYLKKRGKKKKIKRDASVLLFPRTAQPFPDF